MKTFFTTCSAFTAGVLLTSLVNLRVSERTLTGGLNASTSVVRKETSPLPMDEWDIGGPGVSRSASASDFDKVKAILVSENTEVEETSHSFENIVQTAYLKATKPRGGKRPDFNITWWETESGLTTSGGLMTNDRILLAELYSKAESVFEYGLGESTYLADHLKVPRYAGTDSDPEWVGMARKRVSDRFRFYYSDIGSTKEWGYPKNDLRKNVLNYQLAPLIVESLPFDVYMVDGRYRLASALASFLHASARGGDPAKTTVLIHDCQPDTKGLRKSYSAANHLLNLTKHSGSLLCVYQRLPGTTDQQLEELWYNYVNEVIRR